LKQKRSATCAVKTSLKEEDFLSIEEEEEKKKAEGTEERKE